MILDYYGLAEQPFGVTPDPRFMYLSATHREALASMLYDVSSRRGFTALIAKPGMGKTTLLFDLLKKLRNSARTVFLFQFQCGPIDLLRSLLADLGIEDDGEDLVRMQKKLNEVLLVGSTLGKRLVVVIDEAQNLSEPVLEVVRMLSNFETSREKLMHIILAGQPQLAEKLANPRMTQLRQRISIVARLKPFEAEETQTYINHRLRVAGYDFARPLFTKQALAMIAAHSGGIPRNISNICFNAMSLGCATKQKTIDDTTIREVLADLDLGPLFEDSTSVPTLKAAQPPASSALAYPPASSFLNIWTHRVWTHRVALSLAFMAAMGLLFIRSHKYVTNLLGLGMPVSAKEAPIVPAQSQLAAAQPTAAPSSSSDSRTVVVLPNETLYQISLREMGKYDGQAVARFRELNPWLVDPDHIEAGQTIRVSALSKSSQTSHSELSKSPLL